MNEPDLRQTDTGQYTCRGIYANTEEMSAQVEIKTFSKFYFAFYDLYLHIKSLSEGIVFPRSKPTRVEFGFYLD